MVSFLALLAFASYDVAALGQATGPPLSEGGARSHDDVAAKIRILLNKNRSGGNALTLAMQNLLQRDPGAIGAVIDAASSGANAEQALALEQAVVQAMAQLKISNPAGARVIRSYLDANKTNSVVAQIQEATQAQGSIGAKCADVGGASSGGGAAGGGFVGGAGLSVSPTT